MARLEDVSRPAHLPLCALRARRVKRLMGRYASREEEIDFLLRSKRFVDLYGVVRSGLRVKRRELLDQEA